MDAYTQAAEQIKMDLLSEYAKLHGGVSADKVLRSSLNGREVIDNVEIAIRNSVKNKAFSHRVRDTDKSTLDDDDIIQLYITTDDEESYNDGKTSISCSKNILYFLFVMRYENFGITERRKYADALNNLERSYPNLSVTIYGIKKQLVDLMDKGNPDYPTVQPLVKQYLINIRLLLVSQLQIYRCESNLCKIFRKYLQESIKNDFFSEKAKVNSSTVKALIKVFKALDKRGVGMPNYKKKITTETIDIVLEQIEDHLIDLKSETEVINEIAEFLERLIKYMENPAKKVESNKPAAPPTNKNDKNSAGLFDSIKEGFSDWLNKS